MTDPPTELLRCNPLFAGFPEPQLHRIMRFARRRTVHARQVLYAQGDACGEIFLLGAGAVKLTHDGAARRRKVLNFIEPGRLFGETALFSGHGHATSAEALEDSWVLAIQAAPLVRLLQSDPLAAWRALVHVARQCDDLLHQAACLGRYNARQRLAAFLLERSRADGATRTVHLPGRQVEIASLLALTPETLCREVTKMRAQGWIATRGDGVVEIRQPRALEAVLTPARPGERPARRVAPGDTAGTGPGRSKKKAAPKRRLEGPTGP